MPSRTFLALMLLLLAAPSAAAVRTADGSGLVVDREAPVSKRGGEVRYALKFDRRTLERNIVIGRPLLLPSTGSAPLAAEAARIVRRADGLTTVIARVDTAHGPQSAVITLADGIVFGLLPQRDGPALRIETRKGRTWLVEGGVPFASLVDDVAYPPRPTDADRLLRQRQEQRKASSTPAAGPNIDVLVLYTPTLLSVWGSDAAMKARIAHLEAITNQAYVDSAASQTITVVGTYMVDYVNQTDNDETLDVLTAGGSAPLARDAHRLRGVHGADLVALLREFDRTHQTSCGVGWIGGWDGGAFDPNYGFSVSADHGFGEDHCGEWTFSHELGHNMGAHHDVETADGEDGAYPYSHGFRRTLSATSGFATIMAYTDPPQVRIGQFSNPRQSTCSGQPCGDVATADNARGLSEAAPSIAAFFAPPSGTQPTLSVSDVSVTEVDSGTQPARFTFSLSGPAPAPISISIATMHGTAYGTPFTGDYSPVSAATVWIQGGQTSATYDVPVRGDTVVERDEVFALNITAAGGARIVDAQGIATIVNDEPIPQFSLADAEVAEGQSGTTLLTFTASLSAASTSPVSFDIDITEYGIDGAIAGEDYIAQAWENLIIPAGETSLQFSVQVIGDTLPEADERLRLVASGLTGAAIARDWARGWIRNDDAVELPTMGMSGAVVAEGNAGTRVLAFPVTLSATANQAVTFDVAVDGGTATVGSDFQAPASGTIPVGSQSTTVTVQVNGDTLPEGDETVVLRLLNVAGATWSDVPVTGSILDDDGSAPAFATRADRFVEEHSPGIQLMVLSNDAISPARLAYGSLDVLSTSHGGTATAVFNEADPMRSRLDYVPAPLFFGEETVRYRVCEGPQSGRCADGEVAVVMQPEIGPVMPTETGAGWMTAYAYSGFELDPQRFVGAYSATPLVAPETLVRTLVNDSTPVSAWDGARSGTAVSVHTLPSPAGQVMTWKVRVELDQVDQSQLDLYVGVDTDLGQDADRAETRCTSAMTASRQVCEVDITHPGTGVTRYWVVAHNRGDASVASRTDIFEVPLIPGDGTLVATGGGLPARGTNIPVRISWSDPTLLAGDGRVGYVGVRMAADQAPALFPVRLVRTAADSAAIAMRSGEALTLALAPGAAQNRLFVDVPAGASQLTVATTSAQNVDLYLSRDTTPSSPQIDAAPPRSQALASAIGASGNETIIRSGTQLPPGRWYVTPVNADTAPATLQVRADITGAAPIVRPGSYFNAARSGHGLFLYPAAGVWAGLWYTYLQDGTPTWYYLQGVAPGANGIWTGGLYRAMWDGDSHQQTAVGRAIVTPTGPDAFSFTYTLDAETGSEPLAALGRGCPASGGVSVDASSHWFNPATAGTGHSVQFWEDYEFYATFVYDEAGAPRFLTSESGVFAGLDATLPLDRLTGFCPLCTRTGTPIRETVGTLRRVIANGTLSRIDVSTPSWSQQDPVQALGGPGTTQGCAP